MRFDDMSEALKGVEQGSHDLDMVLWSLCEGHGKPIPYYAENWFWDARSEERPSARLSSSTDAVLRFLAEEMPEAKIDISIQGEVISTSITAVENGEEIVEKAESNLPLSEMALALIKVATPALHKHYMIQQKSWDATPG